MVPAPAPTLDVRDLSKTFTGQRALDGVSLAIEPGEIHALLGHNGSGKSTLIKVLAGFHLPDSGAEVRIRGELLEFGEPTRSHELGLRFVHQDLALVGPMTVAENMAFTVGHSRGRVGTIDRRAERHRTEKLLGRLGAEVDVDTRVEALEPIDRAIIAIARAVDGLDGGGLLVLDEPTAALPPNEVERLFSVVRDLKKHDVACLYVTHRMDEIHELTDTFTVLRDGRVVATGVTDEHDGDELISMVLGETASKIRGPQSAEQRSPVATTREDAAFEVDGLRSTRLDGISLQVHPGEIVGVAGVMGSGRESIGPALVGAIDAQVTRVSTAHGEAEEVTPRRMRQLGVVMVPGTRGRGSMIDEMSIAENLTLATLDRYQRRGLVDRAGEESVVRRWMDRFDVRPNDARTPLRFLSGGNKQKVLVAKWLNCDPSVVIMDEPTAGVDVGASAAIHEFIREIATDSVACIVASSDVDDLLAVADRIVVLDRGRISRILEADEITENNVLQAMSGMARNDEIEETRTLS